MMSHEDERRLAAIEQQMLADDPDFVHGFRRHVAASTRNRRWLTAFRNAMECALWSQAVLGAVLVLAAILLASAELVLLGMVLAAVAGWVAYRLRRRRRR